ncbi:hypothetical protein PR002_g17918 [Phytophthora rubi]|uniref:Uncharacterized protein n=1 Tax=Phytophthora rubi TaxID=129364 RepID=A0A6A3K2N0_9STRA|nr:hypothetical protein PR002_g17918 [Phytophthora rubi]
MPVAQLSTDELAAELLAPGDDARVERAGKDAAVKLPHGEVLGVGVDTLRQLLDCRLAMVDDRVGLAGRYSEVDRRRRRRCRLVHDVGLRARRRRGRSRRRLAQDRVGLHGERAGVLLVVVRPPGAGHPHGEPDDAVGALGLRLAERLVDGHAPCVLGRSETPTGSPSAAHGDELVTPTRCVASSSRRYVQASREAPHSTWRPSPRERLRFEWSWTLGEQEAAC